MTVSTPPTPNAELWGVFSVADHLRRRPFVADVLIYDKLVVPVPAEHEGKLWRKWEQRWDPARQAKLLDVIEAEIPGVVRKVPWTAQDDEQWRRHAKQGGLRLDLAQATKRDVSIIQGVDRTDPDSIGQLGERMYLVDQVSPARDEMMMSGVPPGDVTVAAAYGSQQRFNRDVQVAPAAGAPKDTTLLGGFAWPLMVPSFSFRIDV